MRLIAGLAEISAPQLGVGKLASSRIAPLRFAPCSPERERTASGRDCAREIRAVEIYAGAKGTAADVAAADRAHILRKSRTGGEEEQERKQ